MLLSSFTSLLCVLLAICVVRTTAFCQATISSKQHASEILDAVDAAQKAADHDAYRALLYRAVHQSSIEQDTLSRITALRKLAQYHTSWYTTSKGHLDSAQWYVDEGMKWAIPYGDTALLYNFDYVQGDIWVLQERYAQAYERFSELEQKTAEGHYAFLPNFYTSFAKLHYLLDEYDPSFEKLKRAANIYARTADDQNLSAIYNNLGILYKSVGQLDSSLVYHLRSLDISTSYGDTTAMAYSYNNIGQAYFMAEQPDKASIYYQRALEIKPQDPSEHLLTNYAQLLMGRGRSDQAERTLELVLDQSQKTRTIIAAYELLSALNRQRGNYQKALFYTDSLASTKATYEKTSRISEIEKLKAEFELEKKEAKIQRLEEEAAFKALQLRTNRILMVAIAIGLGLILIIGGQFARNKVITTRANNLQLQQQLLRSQMNPHFIFNALSNIQTTILKNENKKAVDYLTTFAKLVRGILERSKHMTSVFSEEVDEIRNYLSLQKVRFGDQLSFAIFIDEMIEGDLIHIPTLLIQPIVENAIEHGIEQSDQAGRVQIQFVQHSDHITCTVDDDGIGYSMAKANEGLSDKASISTDIIRQRLAYYGRKQRQTYRFDISDRLDGDKIIGTRVVIDLPIVEN